MNAWVVLVTPRQVLCGDWCDLALSFHDRAEAYRAQGPPVRGDLGLHDLEREGSLGSIVSLLTFLRAARGHHQPECFCLK